MIPQNKIKDKLFSFLTESGSHDLMDNCVLTERASWLNSQIQINITQSDKNKILIEMKNNSHNGYTEFKKEYNL